MKVRILASLALALPFAACEQQSQPLPFSSDPEAAVRRTVAAGEATAITSSAGASLQFPAGAFAEATEVTVTPVSPPAGLAASGSAVSRGFRVEPEAIALGAPARVETRLATGLDTERAWLASLVLATPDGIEEIGATRLDLRAGLAESSIDRLGTLALVIPEPHAVFLASTGGPAASLSGVASNLLPTGTDSVVARCGGPGQRCVGLSLITSENLVNRIEAAAAVYPRVSGSLVFEGFGATGEISLTSSVRLLMASGAAAENVEVHGVLQPTSATTVSEDASSITLTNVRVRVSGGTGSTDDSFEETKTVVITKADGVGFVTLSRTFTLDDGEGDATVALRFPVRIHQ
jgi:hypothetical protein